MFKLLWPYFAAIYAGMFYASGFPMFGDYTFILGPILAFLLLNWCLDRESNLKKQLLIGWLFALGFYSTGYYWIPSLLKEFGGLFPPFNYLLGITFSFIILPQVYFYILVKKYFKNIFALSAIYTLLEFFIPQQFPSHLGHTFISLAPKFNLSLAPIFGASIYSFIVCLIALSILSHIKNKRMPIYYYSTAIILLLISFVPAQKTLISKDHLSIRLVQPNIGNFIKVDSEKGGANSLNSVFDSYYQLSTTNINHPIDLIIWPETAFPNLMSSEILKLNHSSNTPPLIKQIIEKSHSEMFLGGYDINIKAKSYYGYESDYNAAFYFSNQGELKDVYHKIKLIPFGEGLPFGPLNKFLSNYVTNVSFFAKGDKATLFKLPNGYFFTSAICYEILFPRFIRDLLNENENEPNFIINLTNDSWYGDTFEPYQHLFLTKWRSLEFNIPIVRSTNTGITTIIFPDGSESMRLLINEKKYMDLNLPLIKREKTFFQKFGILSFFIFALILSFLEKTLLSRVRANG